MKRSLIIATLMIAMLGVGCSNGTDKPETNDSGVATGQESVDKGENVVDKESDDKAPSEDKTEDKIEDKKDEPKVEEESKDKVDTVKLKEEKGFRFSKKESEGPKFGTPWKANTSGNKEICIDGRGPEAIEEGPGTLLVKEAGVVKEIVLEDKSDKLTPNYIEWIDDENFLVNMTNKYGRVFTGATIYKVNINDLKPYIVYQAKEDEEISEASKISDDIINIKLCKYSDDGSYTAVEKEIKIK